MRKPEFMLFRGMMVNTSETHRPEWMYRIVETLGSIAFIQLIDKRTAPAPVIIQKFLEEITELRDEHGKIIWSNCPKTCACKRKKK